MFKLMAGSATERAYANPRPIKRVSGAVLSLVTLLTNSVNLDDIFLPSNQGCSGAYWLLLLKNASATGEQYNHRHAKNHIFHSYYILL